MHYEPKRNYMWGDFEEFLDVKKGKHELKVVVEDERGNLQTLVLKGEG
jgi:hypothetical protein